MGTHVITVSTVQTSVTSAIVTYTTAIVAGDLLVSGIRADATGTVAVSDNINGSWTKAWGAVTNNWQYYKQNSAAASANGLVLTVTDTVTANIRIVASQFRGYAAASALDQTSTNQTTASTSWNAGNTASIQAGELVYASWGIDTGVAATFTAGASNGVAATIPTNGTVGTSTTGESGVEYVLASAAGVQNSSASASLSSTWHGGQSTFFAATVLDDDPLLSPAIDTAPVMFYVRG